MPNAIVPIVGAAFRGLTREAARVCEHLDLPARASTGTCAGMSSPIFSGLGED
jgi:hypothetical protein